MEYSLARNTILTMETPFDISPLKLNNGNLSFKTKRRGLFNMLHLQHIDMKYIVIRILVVTTYTLIHVLTYIQVIQTTRVLKW